MAREHVSNPSVVHHQWDADLEPLLEIPFCGTIGTHPGEPTKAVLFPRTKAAGTSITARCGR